MEPQALLRLLQVPERPALLRQPQHLVRLAALPRTPNGKTDRKALPPPMLHSASPVDAEPGVSASDDPRERYLGELWCRLVGADDVRASDNFFDIGGHSLLCFRVIARIEAETQKRISPRLMLLNTLEHVAGQLGTATVAAAPPPRAGPPPPRPPSPPAERPFASRMLDRLKGLVRG